MFDIAFSELVVIGIVALIVIGPEKLPKVARTAGHLFGRAQRYVNDVKSDINREMQFEEMRKLQDEIRQNTQGAESIQYKAGQIVQHKMQNAELPKYEAGQIIKHDTPQTDAAAPQLVLQNAPTDTAEPPLLKQGT